MPVREPLEAIFSAAIQAITAKGTPPKLAEALSYAVFPGGARVRPQICLSVAKACGMDDKTLALHAAVALEMIHCASLVHDDLPCFDDADMRRGKPSVHKAFGEEIAVLVGDTLIVAAFDVIAKGGAARPERALALVQLLARYTGSPYGICAGQAWESEPKVDVQHYHLAKTGALFIAASEMGAVAAGAEPDEWFELGARIGEAYQVADDLRDALYTSEELGKPVGQDDRHGRPSVVTTMGTKGAIAHLKDTLAGAISSIPACPGEAQLAQLVRAQADRLTPMVADLPAAE